MTAIESAPGRLERALGIFTKVERGEARAALALLASVFLILTAYYFIKPAREGWLAVSVIRGLSKIEVKAFSSFAQALVLSGCVPIYFRLASRWPRAPLVSRVILFLASNLLVFWLLRPGLLAASVPFAGVAFYLWVGIFNLFIVAQFWAFTADFYTDERGRRLIPMIAIGATAGAVFGSWLAERLVRDLEVGPYDLLLLAVVPLLLAVWLLRLAESWGPAGAGVDPVAHSPPPTAESRRGVMALVLSRPFLVATAALTVVYGWAGSNGENVLFGAVQIAVEESAVAQGIADPALLERHVLASTTAFYGNFYFWVNVASLGLQALVAARLLRYGGFGVVLFFLPLVTLGGYLTMALVPLLAVIKVAKVAENSSNYSINNTARHVLWLPTTSEMKFKAKQAIDTLGVRLGDGLAAVTVLVGITLVGLSPLRLFWVNVALAVAWILLSVWVFREHRRLSASAEAGEGGS